MPSSFSPLRDVRVAVIRENNQPPQYSSVVFYDIRIGLRQTLRIVGLTNVNGSRIKEHRALEALAREARARKGFCVPEPYFSDAAYGASFIAYVPGSSLYDVINRARGLRRPLLHSILDWIAALESIPPQRVPLPRGSGPDFRFLQHDLRIVTQRHPRTATKLSRLWRAWERQFRRRWKTAARALAHGDFHAGNIKVLPKSNKICVLDFGRLASAPRFWDLAGFLSHIDTLNGRYLKPPEIRRIQRNILRAWHETMAPLSAQDRREIVWLKRYYDLAAVAHLLAWEKDPAIEPHVKRLLRNIL